MKRIGLISAAAVLVLGLAIFLASCGGGGGGGGAPAITPISSPTQGAQSTKAAVNTVRSLSSAGLSVMGMAGIGGVLPSAGMPVAGRASSATARFAARLAPAAKKAAEMRASASGYPITTSCDSGATVPAGTANSMTIDMDSSGSSMTMVFTGCREGDTLTDGTISIRGVSQSSNSASGTIAVGSADHPFVETFYSGFTSTVVDEVTTTVLSMAFTASGTSTADMTFTATANGYVEDIDHVAHTHEKETMSGFSIKGGSGSATTIGGVSYDVVSLTLNGTMTGVTYASDTDQTISHQEGPNTFTNVTIVDKLPSFGAGDEYLSIDGTLSFTATPAGQCIDGTFSIVTNTPLQIDGTTGLSKAGMITINGNVVATFNGDGSMSISVDGGAPVAYSQVELESLCAI